MENYRYLLSLPSELAQIKKEWVKREILSYVSVWVMCMTHIIKNLTNKKELLQQQQDLNQILENNSYENNLKKIENTFNVSKDWLKTKFLGCSKLLKYRRNHIYTRVWVKYLSVRRRLKNFWYWTQGFFRFCSTIFLSKMTHTLDFRW